MKMIVHMLFSGLFWGGGGGGEGEDVEIPLSKTEIWHVSTLIYVVSENIPFSTKAILILLKFCIMGS